MKFKATHRFIENENVKYRKVKGLFGSEIEVTFSSGEKTTMSHKRFNELFKTKYN